MCVSVCGGCASVYVCVRMYTIMGVPVDTCLGVCPCVCTRLLGMLVYEHRWAWVTLVETCSRPKLQGLYSASVGRGLPQPAWPNPCGRGLGAPRAKWRSLGTNVGSLRRGHNCWARSVGPGFGASSGCEFSLVWTCVGTRGGHSYSPGVAKEFRSPGGSGSPQAGGRALPHFWQEVEREQRQLWIRFKDLMAMTPELHPCHSAPR